MAPFCTAGKVHVGLDESFHLGQCPRCRAEVARVGLAGHFAGHVNRLHQLTQSLGLRLGLWADMLALLPAAIPRLPRDVIAYDWYYYPFARQPRVELHNFAEVDLAAPLQARGIEYWGCPMNGAFRYEPLPVFGERLAKHPLVVAALPPRRRGRLPGHLLGGESTGDRTHHGGRCRGRLPVAGSGR